MLILIGNLLVFMDLQIDCSLTDSDSSTLT